MWQLQFEHKIFEILKIYPVPKDVKIQKLTSTGANPIKLFTP